MTFDDEFNSFDSNGPSNPTITDHTGKWDTTLAWGERKLNDEIQLYSDPTLGVEPHVATGGVLHIQAAPSTDLAASWGQPYTSGIITTFHSFSQQYGYFEMRARLPEGAGMWPAFWMLPQEHVWPPELDPLEAYSAINPDGVGGSYSFRGGLVTSDQGGQSSWGGTGGIDLATSFNTFGVLWQPDVITFLFNGIAYKNIATPPDFHQPMYMLANLAVGGNSPGAPHGQTGDLQIDYIRAYADDGANPAVIQERISSPDGPGYQFYGATDAQGHGPSGGNDGPVQDLAPPPDLPATIGTQTIGAGSGQLALRMSEDAYLGHAQFIVTVDGKQVGGLLGVSASHAAGESQTITVLGDFGSTAHDVGITFLNDAWGGTAQTDRNLYLASATIDGSLIPASKLSVLSQGEMGFTFTDPGSRAEPVKAWISPVTIGAGSDTLAVAMSEDGWRGDAQFVVQVDGLQVGGVQTATASHQVGQAQLFSFHGDFGPGTKTIGITFLNDAWGGTPQTDRNLYVDSIALNGTANQAANAALLSAGTATFTASSQPLQDRLVLHMSEDAYRGDAEFTASLDGAPIGAAHFVSALRGQGQVQDFTFDGDFGAGSHDLAITFRNDLWGGTGDTDRNLYVESVDVNGVKHPEIAAAMYYDQTQHFQVMVPVR